MMDFNQKVTKQEVEYYSNRLTSWGKLSSSLHLFSESGLKKAILVELKTKQRINILHRLKGRLNKTRSEAETRIIDKMCQRSNL